MATFSLSGSGVQALTSGTSALYVTITTLPAGLTHGRANPTNHFDIALFRFSDGTGFSTAIPIAGGPDWISVPSGATSVGYSVLNGAVLSVTENFNAPVSPGGGAVSTLLLPDVLSPLSLPCVGLELAASAATNTSSAAWGTANLAIIIPLRLSDVYVCTNAWLSNGGTVNGHWDIGVYDSALQQIAHTGSVLQAGLSTIQNVALNVTLPAGKYWLALAIDSATATVAFSSLAFVRFRALGLRQMATAFPLPVTFTPVAYGIAGVPIFGLSAGFAP